jgi:hypothetical protein
MSCRVRAAPQLNSGVRPLTRIGAPSLGGSAPAAALLARRAGCREGSARPPTRAAGRRAARTSTVTGIRSGAGRRPVTGGPPRGSRRAARARAGGPPAPRA